MIDRLLGRAPFERQSDEERHEAAEQLHALGTAEALTRLDGLPGHADGLIAVPPSPGAFDCPKCESLT